MTEKHPIFTRYPDLKEFVGILRHEIQQAQRPATEIILDDEKVMQILRISKRKLQYMKSKRQITFHTPISGNRTYYLLSDILKWMSDNRVESLLEKIRIK